MALTGLVDEIFSKKAKPIISSPNYTNFSHLVPNHLFWRIESLNFYFFFIFVLCSLRMSNWRWCCLLLSCKSISQPIIYCELDRFELNFTVDCELYQAFDANCLFLTVGLDIFFVQMCFYNSTEDDSIFNLAFWVKKWWK